MPPKTNPMQDLEKSPNRLDGPESESPGPATGSPQLASSSTTSSSQPSPLPGDFIHVYNQVAARRLANVDLIWHTPVIGLTGQAFLFSIALNSTTSQFSRIVSATLCTLITSMTLQIMIQHRRTDEADRAWLKAFEAKYFKQYIEDMKVGPYVSNSWTGAPAFSNGSAHGSAERDRRHKTSSRLHGLDYLGNVRSSVVWAWGLVIIDAIAVMLLIMAAVKPNIFALHL